MVNSTSTNSSLFFVCSGPEEASGLGAPPAYYSRSPSDSDEPGADKQTQDMKVPNQTKSPGKLTDSGVAASPSIVVTTAAAAAAGGSGGSTNPVRKTGYKKIKKTKVEKA